MKWLTNLHQWLSGQKNSSKSRKHLASKKLYMAELEPRLLLSANHFDFGTKTSPVASGYVGVPVVAYNTAVGYGWTNSTGVSAVDRGGTNNLTRDFHTAVDRTFRIDLPNGAYQVNLKLGDASRLRDNIDIYLNGNKVASSITTQAGKFIQPTYGVQVTNGQLNLRLVDRGGRTSGWALDSIDIVPNQKPVVSAGAGQTINEGTAVTFNGTASGIGPLQYTWQFGDGTSASGTLTPKHTYADNGAYTAILTVTDSFGVSSQSSVVESILNVAPRPNALGPYTGVVDAPVHFVGIARDPSTADLAAGFQYDWNFGDGATATGPTPDHSFAATGLYTITLTVTDKDGGQRFTTTTASIDPTGSSTDTLTEFNIESTNLLANTVYGSQSWSDMAADGAWGVNSKWEQGQSSSWYIEQQRYGEDLIIGGLIHNNTAAIEAGFKVFDWGFAHQAADGSFPGTGDAFHSTSLFVQAVAHACLVIEQSPYAQQYQAQVNTYANQVYKAANWMGTPSVWSKGIANDAPYTHRRYIVADALGLTSQLVGGDANLMSLARYEIKDGLSLQWANGVNPELGGYDSSYQTLGLSLAERWATYFPDDALTLSVNEMVNKGLTWEATMILPTGEISVLGDTRTGVETGPSGTLKTVDWKKAVDAFATWYQYAGDPQLQTNGQKIAQFYFKQY